MRNEEKARKMLGPDIDLVRNSTEIFPHFIIGVFIVIRSSITICINFNVFRLLQILQRRIHWFLKSSKE